MNEFDIISKYFAPLSRDGLKDDAATLRIPPGHELIVTSDTSNAGTHFMADSSPGDIARKALRRNLSDLAAMGAQPLCYQLNIAFPQKPQESWLAAFTGALREDQEEFGILCSGGDTTSINGPLSVSITALGLVPVGRGVHRQGAKPGDHVILTGPVGDALIGLRVLQGKIKTGDDDYFIKACYRPVPRTGVAEIVRDHASAAIDISDGLAADLGHVCAASGCGAKIAIAPGIFSEKSREVPVAPADLLTGGDDYELLLAAPPEKAASLLAGLAGAGLKSLKIGEFTAGSGVHVCDAQGFPVPLDITGWTHF